jgi:hypothetical protein
MAQKLSKKFTILLLIAIAVVGFIVYVLLSNTSRSKVSFCTQYNQELISLKKLPSGEYPSELFQTQVNDVAALKKSYSSLAKVAPDEIKGDVNTMVNIYSELEDNPSKLINASLVAKSADENLYSWSKVNCNIK